VLQRGNACNWTQTGSRACWRAAILLGFLRRYKSDVASHRLHKPLRGRAAVVHGVALISVRVCRNSALDCRSTSRAPCNARHAMMAATIRSGQPVPVPNTPSAASRTARLPSTSLREQIQTDRMLLSPCRYAQRSPKQVILANSAANPTKPIVTGIRQGAVRSVPGGDPDNPQTERTHARALGKCCHRARMLGNYEYCPRYGPIARISLPREPRGHQPALHRSVVKLTCRHSFVGAAPECQPAAYSCDLKVRCFTPSGASAIFRIAAQVCL
jgi:hypothetical protein